MNGGKHRDGAPAVTRTSAARSHRDEPVSRQISVRPARERAAELCPFCLQERTPASGPCPACGEGGEIRRTSPLHLPPGTILLDKYLVGRVLGHGGFSITYLALDLSLDVRCCLKEYFPANLVTRNAGQTLSVEVFREERGSGGDPREIYDEGLRRFLDEAQILARFENHPGIVSVRDFFEANGTAYMVTSFFEGITFKQYLEQRGGSISFDATLKILMPVLDSLREVHRAGLLHRDVSPENIYITASGQVKLLDFGAARSLAGEGHSLSVVVKPGYAPEEQYRTRGHQGPWTDVYGAAATFYRALTGKVPQEALERLSGGDLRAPSALGAELPEKAELALVKALAVRAEERFQNIEAFQKALIAARGAPTKQQALRLRKRRLAVGAGAALFLLLLGFGGWYHWANQPEQLFRRGERLTASGKYAQALAFLQKAQDREGGAPWGTLHLLMGHCLLELQRPAEAEEALSRAVLRDPLARQAWQLLGDARVAMDRLAEARSAYARAASLPPQDGPSWLRVGDLARRLHQDDEAAGAYERAVAVDPDLVEGWIALGDLAASRNRPAEAERAFGRATALAPERRDLWKALGEARRSLNNPSGAADAFAEAAERAGNDPAEALFLGTVLLELDRPREAAGILNAGLAKTPHDPALLVSAAEASRRGGDIAAAETHLRNAVAADGASADAWKALGLLLLDANRPDQALSALERAASLHPDDVPLRKHLGIALARTGHPAEAEETLLRAAAAAPDDGEILLALGDVRLGADTPRDALAAYLDAARKDESLAAKALVGQGKALLALGRTNEAAGAFFAATDRDATSVPAWLGLAEASLRREQYRLAVDALRRALILDPNNETAWRRLGQAYFSWGQYDGAIEVYNRILSNASGDEAAELEHFNLAKAYIQIGDISSASRILDLLEERSSTYSSELRRLLEGRRPAQ